MSKHPFKRSTYDKPEADKKASVPAVQTADSGAVAQKPKGRIGRALERFEDEEWMDKTAASPRVVALVKKIDRAIRFMTSKKYKTGNEPMDAARGPIVVGLWAFVFVFVFMFGWAALAPLESAAIAPGAVVLDSDKKVIQHLEGGIVDEILVREGQFVEKGAPLVKLNEVTARARSQILENQFRTAKAVEARLLAERDGKDEITFDEVLLAQKDLPEVASLLESQRQLFASRRDSFNGQVDIFKQRVKQLQDEIKGITAQRIAVDAQIKYIQEEIDAVERLVERGQALKPRLLSLKRQQSELQGNRGQYVSSIARAKQTITENELQIINLKNEMRGEVVGHLAEIKNEIDEIYERQSASTDILDRIVITAPQAGVVTNLMVHTKGGVVKPGGAIMYIVPQDDKLIIEAHVTPMDIDIVHQGLKAKVRLSAYSARFAPMLEGEVLTVSADRVVDQNTGAAHFLARVQVNTEDLKEYKDMKLYPGMPAEVLIVTGSTTFLSYMFDPIFLSFNKAFREM